MMLLPHTLPRQALPPFEDGYEKMIMIMKSGFRKSDLHP